MMRRLFHFLFTLTIFVLLALFLFKYAAPPGSAERAAGEAQKAYAEFRSGLHSAVSELSAAVEEYRSRKAGSASGIAASKKASGSQPEPVAGKITSAPPTAPGGSGSSAADDKNWYAFDGLKVYEYGRSLLSGKEQAVYDQLVSGVEAVNARISMASDLPVEKVQKVYEYFLNDHAEVFYLNSSTLTVTQTQKIGSVSTTYSFAMDYTYNKSTVETKRGEFIAGAKKLLGVVSGKTGDYKKELALHDALIRACSYDTVAAENPTAYPAAYTAYGTFTQGKAVCDGYAKAMKLLLDSAGIRSICVDGMASNGMTTGPHAWNMACVSGIWYDLDATFDDPIYINAPGYSTVSYTYFNKTAFTDHQAGAFDTADPFKTNSENYAVMPTAGK